MCILGLVFWELIIFTFLEQNLRMKKKVVIIGAGFGGVSMAKHLRNKNLDVLVLDQNNYHNFQPLMYQIASGALEPHSIAYPIRRIFRKYKNLRFRMANVEKIDHVNHQLETNIGLFTYDYLIIATGSTTNYFSFEPVKDKLLTLKSIPDALNIRSFLFQNLEKALRNNLKDESLEEIMSIAVVGGGPAGIEMAGALAEMKKHVIPRDFPEIDTSMMHINLYQSSPKLLKTMSAEASEESLTFLKELGVNVHLNSRVINYKEDHLFLKDGSSFKTDTVIWTAGVKGAVVAGLPENVIVGGNRIAVDEYNQVQGLKDIFAIGDVACAATKEHPRGLPGLAPVAQQQGEHLAKNILNVVKGKSLNKFVYKDKGSMATIGRKRAVVDLPKYNFQGSFAWFVWMFVHIMSLIGFRNKIVVFLDWLGSYMTYDKPLGLIIRKYKRG